MDAGDNSIEFVKWAGGIFAAIAVAVGGVFAGKKSVGEPSGEARVLDASIVDKRVFTDMVTALNNIKPALDKIVEHLEAEAQRRHDAELIRREMERRGIRD